MARTHMVLISGKPYLTRHSATRRLKPLHTQHERVGEQDFVDGVFHALRRRNGGALLTTRALAIARRYYRVIGLGHYEKHIRAVREALGLR